MNTPICKICNKLIINCRYIHNEWGETIHADHENVEQCRVCGRFISHDYIGVVKHKVCNQCSVSIVKDDAGIEWVRNRVVPILTKNGININYNEIPIEIVSSEALCRHYGLSEVNYNIRGLTSTKWTISVFGKKMKHTIYMVEDLPKVAYAGVLAHEYMHVWLNENDIKMKSDKIEGFCNIGSFLTLESINHELSAYLIKCMKESKDPIYGDGFRFMLERYHERGLEELIKKIKTFK